MFFIKNDPVLLLSDPDDQEDKCDHGRDRTQYPEN
jgi:hypothetical protein